MFDDLKEYKLMTYSDADWAADTKDWKSMMKFLIKIVRALIYWRLIKQTNILLFITETKYIIISETVKNIIITHRILHELSIISKDFIFSLLINNISAIAISESEKVIRNTRHIDIYYHHIQNLIKKKIIEIFHISTDKMTADDLIKALLSNKFKEFIELIEISKIEVSNSKTSDDKTDNNEFNDNNTSNDKNDENLVMNYYKEADEEISFWDRKSRITEWFYIKKKILFQRSFYKKLILFWSYFELLLSSFKSEIITEKLLILYEKMMIISIVFWVSCK